MKNKNLSKNNTRKSLKSPEKKIDKKAGKERLVGRILEPKDETAGQC